MAESSRPAPPDLTRAEIDEICHPLVQNAAKVRFLQGLGVKVERRPDGSPLVSREHYVKVRGGVLAPEVATEGGPVWGVH